MTVPELIILITFRLHVNRIGFGSGLSQNKNFPSFLIVKPFRPIAGFRMSSGEYSEAPNGDVIPIGS